MTRRTKLSEPEITLIQNSLRSAMLQLDACGQDDLSERVKAIFKEVGRRAFNPDHCGCKVQHLPHVWRHYSGTVLVSEHSCTGEAI